MDVIGQPSGGENGFSEQIFNLEQHQLNIYDQISKINSHVIDNEQDKFVLQNKINIPLENFSNNRNTYTYIIDKDNTVLYKIYLDIKLKKKIQNPLYFYIETSDGASYKLNLSKDYSKNIYFFSFGYVSNVIWVKILFNTNNKDISDYIESISYSFDGYDNLDYTIVISESDYNKDISISNNALCLLTDE